ncbi:MAG: hypothetical protein H0W33_09945 [Gammaproteobacteria bacterium]|nr:hypothetical protein [Gammaproteobacteria bacterium]
MSLIALFAAAASATAQGTPAGELNHSILAPLARHSLLLDGAAVDGFMAVVGERGHVLLNDDEGPGWRQVRVPTTATLTGVFFSDRKHGWAVGHDAVILRTADGGASWERAHFAPEEERPLLDVWFRDARHGYAVGAYSYFLQTSDGGLSWRERSFEAQPWPAAGEGAPGDDPEGSTADQSGYDLDTGIDAHLNDIAAGREGRLYIAAEAGRIYRSDDGGDSWWSMPSPYEGSLFGVLPLDEESLLVFGLRGHLYRSDDGGMSWRVIESSTQAMLTDGMRLGRGTVVLTGLAGTLLVSRNDAQSFDLVQLADRRGIATALAKDADTLWLIGESGLQEFTLPDERPAGDGR